MQGWEKGGVCERGCMWGGNVLWMEAGKRECNQIDSTSGAAETTLESQRRGCQTVDSPRMDRPKSGLQGV